MCRGSVVVDVGRTEKKWSRCGVVDIGRGLVRVGEGGEGVTFQSSFLGGNGGLKGANGGERGLAGACCPMDEGFVLFRDVRPDTDERQRKCRKVGTACARP